MLFDEGRRRGEVDYVGSREPPKHFLQPVNTFEPPMPEQLGVVIRCDHAILIVGLVVGNEKFLDQSNEMLGMFRNSLLGASRIVRWLASQIETGAANPPVLHSGHAV